MAEPNVHVALRMECPGEPEQISGLPESSCALVEDRNGTLRVAVLVMDHGEAPQDPGDRLGVAGLARDGERFVEDPAASLEGVGRLQVGQVGPRGGRPAGEGVVVERVRDPLLVARRAREVDGLAVVVAGRFEIALPVGDPARALEGHLSLASMGACIGERQCSVRVPATLGQVSAHLPEPPERAAELHRA